MAEYTLNDIQNVSINQPALFNTSIGCRKGYIYHENGEGIFILRGITNQCFATYQVTFNGNIAIPTGGTVGSIAMAIAVNGEPRLTSRAIITPAAVEEYGNITSTCIIKVPKGCCFSLSVEAVSPSEDPTVTPAPVIELQNANLVINRIA